MNITCVTNHLRALAKQQPEEFPGTDSDERKNAERYVRNMGNLHHACVPLYQEAAQASLKEDIRKIEEKIRTADAIQRNEVLQLLDEKVRYLNGHGPDHLQRVDAKAYELIQAIGVDLSPYEVFFLAAGLTIHDAGLIFGRDNHESSISSILNKLGDNAGTRQERLTIERIASAHGGYVAGQPGNRATIDTLVIKQQVSGRAIRGQLIAAIVRLADELAEDESRATAIEFDSPEERRSKLGGSEIYHVYSSCLESCYVDREDKAIKLQFLLNLDDALSLFKKGGGQVYLIDEIYERTLKTFNELLYCNRFIYQAAEGVGLTALKEIRVSIEIYGSESGSTPLISLPFTLKENGYPTLMAGGVNSYCPELSEAIRSFGVSHSVSESDVRNALTNGPTGSALADVLNKAAKTET